MLRVLVPLAFTLLFSSPVQSFWIISHKSLVQERLDPIVTPGNVSSHVHNIIGSSSFGPTVSYDSLRADKNCTTSPVQADMSAYWVPQVYRHNHENDTYTLVPIDYVHTYYMQRIGLTQNKVEPFPPKLRMVAGNPMRTVFNASNQADNAISWGCLNYNTKSTKHTEFPDMPCPNGLVAQIVFPSCWTGDATESDDNSHMSYPLGDAPDNGDCPETHKHKLVTLFHEWVFQTWRWDFQSGKKNWVLSTGDETGLTLHADFVNGWDTKVLQEAIDQCTGSLFENVEGCPPFVPTVSRDLAAGCRIPRVVDEEIDGPLTKLPGCNPVPFTGTMASCPGASTPAIKGSSGDAKSSEVSEGPSMTMTSTIATQMSTEGSTTTTSSTTSTELSTEAAPAMCKRHEKRMVKRHSFNW